MFEIPRIYKEGMNINNESEVVIWQTIDTGSGKRPIKQRYVISRRYQHYLDEKKIKSLKEEIQNLRSGEEIRKLKVELGENESYIEELEAEIESLRTKVSSCKDELSRYKSGVKAGEMYEQLKKKIEVRDKHIASLRKSQTDFIVEKLKKDREIEELKKRIKELEEGVI